MANSKSPKKELRKSKKRAVHNKSIKDKLKSLVKKSRKAIDQKDNKNAEELVKKTLKALDKAGQKGIIKKNTRDRKKSRLYKRLNKTS